MQRRNEQTAGTAKIFDGALNLRCQIPRRRLLASSVVARRFDNSCGKIVILEGVRGTVVTRSTIATSLRSLAPWPRALPPCTPRTCCVNGLPKKT